MPGKDNLTSSSQSPRSRSPAPKSSSGNPQPSHTPTPLPQVPQIHVTDSESQATARDHATARQDRQLGSRNVSPSSRSPKISFQRVTSWLRRRLSRSPSRNRNDSANPPAERTGTSAEIEDDPLSNVSSLSNSLSPSPAAPNPAPAGETKAIFIGTTKLLLQVAAFTLKLSPVPLLGQIPDLLLSLLQLSETVGGNNDYLKDLDDEARRAYTVVLLPLQLWTGQIPPEVIKLIGNFHSELEAQIDRIRKLQNQKLAKRIILAIETAQVAARIKGCINDAITSFMTEATILALLRTIQSSVQSELRGLSRVAAEHTYVKTKSGCLEGTRVRVQTALLEHLKKTENRFVWLRGSPGTGKTAICLRIAFVLEAQGTLAASFFWDKNQVGEGLDSIEQFPSTIARQLAHFNEEFKASLLRRLHQPGLELAQHLPLEKQMEALITEPMRHLKELLSSGNNRFVIILDGLDECGGPETLEALMKLVLMLEALPPAFVVLVSSRPESQVIRAWGQLAHVVPCENTDAISKDENFDTIRRMIEEGLKDRIEESPWKPSAEDIDGFSSACRGLPVIASIRIRDVCAQTQQGSTLELEFEYFRNLMDAPIDLNSEYLRILRRAYITRLSGTRPRVIQNYRQVIGMIIAAHQPLSLYSISQLLGIKGNEIHAALRPISSIIEFSSDGTGIPQFYHATMKEFITGQPIGNENDREFFIDDKKGYFLALPLLRFIDGLIKRNELDIPAALPKGDRGEWRSFESKGQPEPVNYAVNYLFDHLDPSQLFLQQPNELHDEFNHFLTKNLLSFVALCGKLKVPDELLRHKDHGPFQLLIEAKRALGFLGIHGANKAFSPPPHQSSRPPFFPWHLYRSVLPFSPSSSQLFQWYHHLSDPVQIFSITGEFSGRSIPLSDDALRTWKIMEAKLGKPKNVSFRAEFLALDVRNGVVVCATLSADGRYIALGFGSGAIEIADIDDQRTVSRFQQQDTTELPSWIEFVCDNNQIATEDIKGKIVILGRGPQPVKVGSIPNDNLSTITAVADNGSFIARVSPKHWHKNIAILHVSEQPSIQYLTFPSNSQHTIPPSAISRRHALLISPGGQYIIAHDTGCMYIWSTDSWELVTNYPMRDFKAPVLIYRDIHPRPYLITSPVIIPCLCPGDWGTDNAVGHDSDQSWLEWLHHSLSQEVTNPNILLAKYGPSKGVVRHDSMAPISNHTPTIWFNGRVELVLPKEYHPIKDHIGDRVGWYGDRLEDDTGFCLPLASRDGTRFLVQGHMKAPIVVDIRRVV